MYLSKGTEYSLLIVIGFTLLLFIGRYTGIRTGMRRLHGELLLGLLSYALLPWKHGNRRSAPQIYVVINYVSTWVVEEHL